MRRSAVTRTILTTTLGAAVLVLAVSNAMAQPGRGGPRGEREASAPVTPEAVSLPAEWKAVTGPGPMFDSAPSLAPKHTTADLRYETLEYFVSGTADGKPYTTRVVIRRPGRDADFSGIVLAEAMHVSGAAHVFEMTSYYTMSAGHAAVEILTTSPQQFTDFNAARYGALEVANGQTNEILAQVGALIKSPKGPLALPVRKAVLAGSSMSAGVVVNYLPAHARYRTPGMQHIYDGFLPTSIGATIDPVDVPLIQLPTLREVESNVPRRNDGDAANDQFRLYEFVPVGHVDSRDNVRLTPNPCAHPLSTLPLQAYYAVGLDYLVRWVDEGIVPPRADRVWLDRNVENDGSQMLLDEHGNPLGGIRSPYVDVPAATYKPTNVAADPLPAKVSAYVQANGPRGASQMCGLSNYQIAFSKAKLKALYGSPGAYRKAFAQRLGELEAEGWSLPLYHDMIMADAEAIEF
jgi:hypothetical protein